MTNQPALFDDDAGRAKADAVYRADLHADIRWKIAAQEAVRWCADNYPEFTADQVWKRLAATSNATTHEPSALGPIFLWASRQKIIRKTGYVRLSEFTRRHRDLTVWTAA